MKRPAPLAGGTSHGAGLIACSNGWSDFALGLPFGGRLLLPAACNPERGRLRPREMTVRGSWLSGRVDSRVLDTWRTNREGSMTAGLVSRIDVYGTAFRFIRPGRRSLAMRLCSP